MGDSTTPLAEEVFEEVGHAQWVFVMPKMLRPYFLHHRELLGGLARAAWETVLELICAAAGDEGMRPGMVAVVQTAGDLANWHPHVHAIVSRGGWMQDGEWIQVAFVDEHSAELLYRHKVMRLLQDEGLLSDERTELLLSWRHTGFSVHNRVRVEPEDQPAVERLARYIMRPPISLRVDREPRGVGALEGSPKPVIPQSVGRGRLSSRTFWGVKWRQGPGSSLRRSLRLDPDRWLVRSEIDTYLNESPAARGRHQVSQRKEEPDPSSRTSPGQEKLCAVDKRLLMGGTIHLS